MLLLLLLLLPSCTSHLPCPFAASCTAVKSSNVLLTSRGVAKLADVGLARMQASALPSLVCVGIPKPPCCQSAP